MEDGPTGLGVTPKGCGRFLFDTQSTGSQLCVLEGGRGVCFAEQQHEVTLPPQASFCEGPRMTEGTGVYFFEVLVEATAPPAKSLPLRGCTTATARRWTPVLSVGLSKLLPAACPLPAGRQLPVTGHLPGRFDRP